MVSEQVPERDQVGRIEMGNPYGQPEGADRTPYGGHPPTGSGPLDDVSSPMPPPIPLYSPQQHNAGSAPWQRPPQDQVATGPLRYADWGERAGAFLVDFMLILAGMMVAGMVSSISDALGSIAAFGWLGMIGYFAWLNGSKGQSPGKAIMGLKLVREADQSTLGGPVGLVRALVLVIGGAVTGGVLYLLALLWPLWDDRNQALHDKLVSATVLAGAPRAKFGKEIFLP